LGNGLNITLGEKTSLTMKPGFLQSRNRINSIVIQGSHVDYKTAENRAWLWSNALDGTAGQFPEVSFKNLKTVTLEAKSLDGLVEMNLIVENVWQLTAKREVFGSTSFNASFTDVADLNLHEDVLATSNYNITKPKLFINRSYIRELPPIRGKILTELKIENSEIDVIKTNALKIPQLDSLVFDNVTIQTIETGSISSYVS